MISVRSRSKNAARDCCARDRGAHWGLDMERTPAEKVVAALRALGRDRAGVTAVEYALIAGLIALAIISAASLVGSNLASFFTNLQTSINAAP